MVEERLRIDLEREVYERRILELKAELLKNDPKVFADMVHNVNVLRTQNKELTRAKTENEAQAEKDKEEMEVLSEKLERLVCIHIGFKGNGESKSLFKM